MKTYLAALIGLGRIGQGFDYECQDDAKVLTHAQGYQWHPGFKMVAGYDSDIKQRKRFESKFDASTYDSIESLFAEHRPEVVSIAVPTALHFEVFQQVIAYRPLAVLCEKPIAETVEQGKRMLQLAQENSFVLLVNYLRRFEPGVLQLRKLLENQTLGNVYKGMVWYSNGLRNNASHYIDLFQFLLGPAEEVKVVNPHSGRFWTNHDPEPDIRITFGTTDVYFLSMRSEAFWCLDGELIGTGGKISYREAGSVIELHKTEEDPLFPSDIILSRQRESIAHDFQRYQWHVVDHLYQHLTEGKPLNSNGETAIQTLSIIDNLSAQL